MEDLDERVVNMYKDVKNILTRYRSGKLPKAFKIIPNLANWEQVAFLKTIKERDSNETCMALTLVISTRYIVSIMFLCRFFI